MGETLAFVVKAWLVTGKHISLKASSIVFNSRWCGGFRKQFKSSWLLDLHSTRPGTIRSLSLKYQYRNQSIRIDTVIMLYRYTWMYNFTLDVIQLSKKTRAYLVWSWLCCTLKTKLWYTLHRWSFIFTTICSIRVINHSQTFTLLLKSKIIYFKTLLKFLSRVHVYHIENVSYW